MQINLRILLLILGTIFTLALRYIHIPEDQQFKLLILFMIVFGVPHGALDLYIEKRNLNDNSEFSNRILSKYLLNIVGYALVWYFFPVIAFVFFILITSYHFGEIDWLGKSDNLTHKLMYSLIGLSWISFFLSHNVTSAIKIFIYLGNSKMTYSDWLHFASIIKPVSLFSLILLYGILFFTREYFFHKKYHYFFSLIQVALLMVICFFCPLWIGFGFYFGLWHSILSFDKIRINFNMENTSKQWISLLKKAFPFSIMAWLGMLFTMLLFYNSKNTTGIISLLFITLSVLTLPHLQIFTKLRLKLND